MPTALIFAAAALVVAALCGCHAIFSYAPAPLSTDGSAPPDDSAPPDAGADADATGDAAAVCLPPSWCPLAGALAGAPAVDLVDIWGDGDVAWALTGDVRLFEIASGTGVVSPYTTDATLQGAASRGLFGAVPGAAHLFVVGAAATAATMWKIEDHRLLSYGLRPSTDLAAAWGFDERRVWTVGAAGALWSCEADKLCDQIPSGTDVDLLAVTGARGNDTIYIVGAVATLLAMPASTTMLASPCATTLPDSITLRGVASRAAGGKIEVLAVGDSVSGAGAPESVLVSYEPGGACSVAYTTDLGLPRPVVLRDIWVGASGDAFIVGDGGTVLRWTPTADGAVEPLFDGRTVDLRGVWGSSREVYAVGAAGAMYRRQLP